MTDKITIGIDADTKDAEKKIKDFTTKIKSMRGITEGLGDSPRDMQMKQAFQRSEGIYRDKLQKQYENQDKIIGELLKKEKELGKQLGQKIKDQEKLNQITQEYLQTIDQIRQKTEIQKRIKQRIGQPEDEQEVPVKKGFRQNIQGFLGKAQKIGPVIAAALGAGLNMADFVNRRRDQFRAERTISLAESMFEPSRRAMKGGGIEDLIYAEERNSALKSSMEMGTSQFGINKGLSSLTGMGGALAVGGGLLSLLTGGAALPAVLAMAAGGVGLTSNKGFGYEGLKGAITGDFSEINKITGQQIMSDYKTKIAEQKAENPIRTMFKDFLIENQSDLIQGIRQSGMGESSYMSKYVQGRSLVGSEEFFLKDRMGMTQSMIGAGGSTSGAYGQNMMTALQAQRGLGLTNAGQAMGRLTNYLSANESNEAFIRILGKGVSVGLDGSKFREEQKDYFNQVTAIAQQVGTGEDLIASLMAGGVGENISRRQVQFAAESTQDLLGRLSKSEGIEGAIKARDIGRDKTFQNLSGFDKMMLQRMNISDIEEGNKRLGYFYEKAGGQEKTGLTEKQFAEKLKKIFGGSLTSGYGDLSKKYSNIQSKIEDLNKKGTLSDEESKQLRLLEEEGSVLYEYMQDIKGPSEKSRTQERSLRRMQKMKSAEDDFTKKYARYRELKTNEKILSEEERKELKLLSKDTAGFQGTPEEVLEQYRAKAAQMQQQEYRSTTVKDGKNMQQVMEEMLTNLSSNFDKTVKERLQLKEFNKALADGAEEAAKALALKIRGIEIEEIVEVHPKYGTTSKKYRFKSTGNANQKQNVKPNG